MKGVKISDRLSISIGQYLAVYIGLSAKTHIGASLMSATTWKLWGNRTKATGGGGGG